MIWAHPEVISSTRSSHIRPCCKHTTLSSTLARSLRHQSCYHYCYSMPPHMCREVVSSIVGVDKGAIDDRHRLEDIAQRLADVVHVAERRRRVEHNVDLHVELIARVVCLQALNLLDCLGEAHREVEHYLCTRVECVSEPSDYLSKGRFRKTFRFADSRTPKERCEAQKLTCITLICCRAEATEILDVLHRGLRPLVDYHQGQDQATEGIEPPNIRIESN